MAREHAGPDSNPGGFAALAFVKPQLFSSRLVDGQGRIVYDSTSGYIVGGVFAALSAGLIAAGIVNPAPAPAESEAQP